MSQRVWVGTAMVGVVCVALLALIGRLAHLQVVERPRLEAWAYERQTSTVPLPGRRGMILDRRHRVLAGSQDRPTVYADPRAIEDHAGAARQLAMVLNLPAEQIQQALDHPASPGYVVLKRGADPPEAEGLGEMRMPGVGVHDEPARTYPMGGLAAHVVGFIGRDGEGLEGIELTLDGQLRARAGRRVVFRDVRRRAVFQKEDSYTPPRDGMHVVLTIDAAIQEVVERAVREQVAHFEAESGLGIVMDPKTGEILALTSFPTFEPARASEAPADARRNRALTDPVEPGSVFKPFVMSAALAEAVTRPEEVIFCHNGLYVVGKRLLHDHHPYGNLTVAEVLAKSSNIGMGILGQRLGNKRMYATLRALGYGQATGIDLPGEDLGLLMPLKEWTSYSTTSVPMGQELAITPIQTVTAFSALVNGGRLLRPRVVRAILDSHGGVIEDHTATVERDQAISPAVSATMRELLVGVVTSGTGKGCDLDRWQVMGKTGTAQVPRKGRRGYEPNAYLASFVAAAPASDPAIVVLVMVRKPNARIGYYGSAVALPGVRKILEETLPYLGILPDKTGKDETRLVWDARGD